MTKFRPHFTGAAVSLAIAVGSGVADAQISKETTQRDRLDNKAPAARIEQPPELRLRQKDVSPAPTIVMSHRVIESVRIDGSSLPKRTLDSSVASFVGQTLNAARLQAMADAVSLAYARSSIALYSILVPDQSFLDGVVRLVAVENYVDEVVLAGPEKGDASATRAYAAKMARERPLTRPTLERYALLMNDLPGTVTTPRVVAGDRIDTVKMVLETKRKPVETAVTLNTRGAARLGRTQLQGDVYFNGWGAQGNQTKLTAAASADFKRFLSLAGAQSFTFAPSGLTVSASAGFFETKPDDGAPEGRGYTAGLQAVYPIVRRAKVNVFLAGGIDGVNSDNALFGQIASSDRTRAVRGSVSASGQSKKTAWSLNASVSQGLDALGARVSDPASATPSFTKGNIQASVTHALTSKWRIEAGVTSQASGDAVPAAELFSLGGDKFGRAFETGALSGDTGVAGSLELTRRFGKLGPIKGAEVYGFFDAGQVWLHNRPGLIEDQYDLASAGAGVRALVTKKTSVGVEAARAVDVIRDGVDPHDWRLTFSIGSQF